MFEVLSDHIISPVGFKFLSKLENKTWRSLWDFCLFITGVVPGLLFGVAVGNVMQGLPFHFDETLRITYTGTFFELLNPFALICGVISLSMFMRHGGIYLSIKTEGAIAKRLSHNINILTLLQLGGLVLAWWYIYHKVPGYMISSTVDPLGPSNPLNKTVVHELGHYAMNFRQYAWMLIAPAMAFGGIILSQLLFWLNRPGISFIFSALSVAGTVSIVGLSMFPFILPSISHPAHSLTLWDASSSRMTLLIMLTAALIFVPIILMYTSWVYHVLRGKVSATSIEKHSGEMY
jgi:cytochrome d ubiquinol oxidase subunit II